MKPLCSLLLALLLVTPRAWAQDAGGEEDIVKSTQSDLMMVGAAGVGGAVLGLSTLSFYDKPSKHIGNIWMGAAVGIIAGVIVVAVIHAQKTQENMTEEASLHFDTRERSLWHLSQNTTATPASWANAPLWSSRF